MSCCYNFFCHDRIHLTGNGVFIAVSSDLIIMLRESTLETECEIFWVKINIVGSKTLYVCAFYCLDEGDAISLKNFDRSMDWLHDFTYLDSRRHEPPWI